MTEWTCLPDLLPEIAGQGLYLVSPTDQPVIESSLRAAGYEIRVAEGTDTRAATMSALCAALGVRPVRNYDAFADVLSDVRSDTGRVALLWRGGERLLGADLRAWTTLVELLTHASVEHWDPDNDDDPANLVFETVVFVDGFGVESVT